MAVNQLAANYSYTVLSIGLPESSASLRNGKFLYIFQNEYIPFVLFKFDYENCHKWLFRSFIVKADFEMDFLIVCKRLFKTSLPHFNYICRKEILAFRSKMLNNKWIL